jgi:hypothetical protein
MFFADPVAAFRNIRSAMKPSGRLLLAVFRSRSENPWQGTRFRVIEAADALLEDGFHVFEPDNGLRWTDGDAGVPPVLFDGFDGPPELVLHVVGGGENPRINGAESVPESRLSSHRAALGSVGPAAMGNQPSLLMVKDGCPATLCKRWPTAPAFGGCRR